jgi:NTP pyrophosphatase (non-canonical NTP hydrolase)
MDVGDYYGKFGKLIDYSVLKKGEVMASYRLCPICQASPCTCDIDGLKQKLMWIKRFLKQNALYYNIPQGTIDDRYKKDPDWTPDVNENKLNGLKAISSYLDEYQYLMTTAFGLSEKDIDPNKEEIKPMFQDETQPYLIETEIQSRGHYRDLAAKLAAKNGYKNDPATIILGLCEEAGEVAKAFNVHHNPNYVRSPHGRLPDSVEHESEDVLIYLGHLANAMGLSINF